MNTMLKISILLLQFIVYSVNAQFSNKSCHIENSMLFSDAIENCLGEKTIKRIYKREILSERYSLKRNSICSFFKIIVTFNSSGDIIYLEFPLNSKLSKNKRNKIVKYLIENKISFKMCWNDLFTIDRFDKKDQNRLSKIYFNNFDNNKIENHIMNVYYPGTITEEQYKKYIE